MFNKEELLNKVKGHIDVENNEDLLNSLIDEIDDFNERYVDRFGELYIDFVNESTGYEFDPYETFNIKIKKSYKGNEVIPVIVSELSLKELDVAICTLTQYFEEFQGIKKVANDSLKESNDKIYKHIEEANKNNDIVFKTIENLSIAHLDTFTTQFLDGQLYNLNRSEEVILALKDHDWDKFSQRWVNDYALIKLLRYYYNKCADLEGKLKLAEDKIIVNQIMR